MTYVSVEICTRLCQSKTVMKWGGRPVRSQKMLVGDWSLRINLVGGQGSERDEPLSIEMSEMA